MNSKAIYILFLISVLLIDCSKSDSDILTKTNQKLQDLTSVKYKFDFKIYNPMTGELGKNDSLTAIFDFTSNDSILGAKYYLSGTDGDFGFNGFTSFYTVKEKKQLIYNTVHSVGDLVGIQHSVFSIKELRDLLPQVLNDSAIALNRVADTVIDNIDCIAFDILMHGKRIDTLGNIVNNDKTVSFYNLFLDKKDLLPKQFVSFSDKKSPIMEFTYSNIILKESVNDSIFDYSLQRPDYTKYTTDEFQLVSRKDRFLKNNSYLGVDAPDWTLPSMTGDSIALSQLDANLVLLEFWFPNCHGCILAIPDINEIQAKYKKRGLKLYGIEFTKTDSIGLANYIKKRGIEYPTLYSGREVASNYGVGAGPTFFLIRNGKFVYAKTAYFKEELIEEIERNLN